MKIIKDRLLKDVPYLRLLEMAGRLQKIINETTISNNKNKTIQIKL